MNPWVKRGAAVAERSEPCTHALVVGVSYYQFLPQTDHELPRSSRETFGLRQVTTPATSAWMFAQWLANDYNNPNAPIGTIRLLLSPSEWERQNVADLAELPVEVLPATRDNVAEAVGEWHDDANANPENVTILYASGHGIQVSKDDGGIVLLEDFAKENSVLTHSLDVGAVRRGMAGPSMAQQQFYFVDACEVRPTEAIPYQSMGRGVDLPNPFEGAVRCSTIYFSAAPSTAALARPGEGTLFIKALLECLELAAVDSHRHENGWWVVTTGTLMKALPKRVKEVAQRFSADQAASTGGTLEEVIFHVLRDAPEVPVTLEIEPDTAVECAHARLWDGVAESSAIFEDEPFTPTLSKSVPAGQYVVTVNIEPPIEGYGTIVRAFPVFAVPPGLVDKIRVPPA